MTLGTKSSLVLSLSAALLVTLGAACKKKATEGAASGTGSGTATAAPPVIVDAAPAPVEIDAAAPAADIDAAAAEPPAAASLPPELKALEDTIAPILAMADEAARTKAACKALPTITKQIDTVGDHPPAGVDGTAWNEIAERMAGSLSDFGIECGEGEASSTKALTEAAETGKELHALLPR